MRTVGAGRKLPAGPIERGLDDDREDEPDRDDDDELDREDGDGLDREDGDGLGRGDEYAGDEPDRDDEEEVGRGDEGDGDELDRDGAEGLGRGDDPERNEADELGRADDGGAWRDDRGEAVPGDGDCRAGPGLGPGCTCPCERDPGVERRSSPGRGEVPERDAGCEGDARRSVALGPDLAGATCRSGVRTPEGAAPPRRSVPREPDLSAGRGEAPPERTPAAESLPRTAPRLVGR